MIYLDNAATTMTKPPEVARAITEALGSFGGVGRGVHPASIQAGLAVYEARAAVSQLFDAPGPERVSFALNATMALNIAIAGLLPDGGKAVTTAASHNSVLRPLYAARDARDCAVEVVPIDDRGALDYDAFARACEGAALVAVTHASNLTGDVYDAARMADAAHAAGALVVLDAAQTAGAVPVDMGALGVDVVCFTGHKSLLGPQGTGGLCVAAGVDVPPLLEGGSGTHSFDERHPRFMPESLEAGTVNAHGLAGLAAGVAYLQQRGVADVATHEAQLVVRFVDGLHAVKGVRVLGGGSDAGRCGIVALNVADADSAGVADRLASEWDICTRAGAHCAPLMHRALGTERQGAVRVSFGPFSTEGEVDACLEALEVIAHDVSCGR
ncbi:MAG: aminotransferase class V-fold PLP-dependent enzyme [Eggerthellaceae bacterium]|nr:aminotransferase class V-fold PLP-dependent enzyme [Eggerthellaceae bacterium]